VPTEKIPPLKKGDEGGFSFDFKPLSYVAFAILMKCLIILLDSSSAGEHNGENSSNTVLLGI
jgi:hypothetical protein